MLISFRRIIYTILKCSGGKLLKATKNLVDNMRNAKENNNQKLSVSEIKYAMIEYDEKYNDIYPGEAKTFILDYLNGLTEETLIKDNNKLNTIKKSGINENYYHLKKGIL